MAKSLYNSINCEILTVLMHISSEDVDPFAWHSFSRHNASSARPIRLVAQPEMTTGSTLNYSATMVGENFFFIIKSPKKYAFFRNQT
ncbi:MAG: hypothetical protein ACYTE5_03795 [Planctomycetota bacterium]|jgi:hypothetical protein